jgi:hypothetical protein
MKKLAVLMAAVVGALLSVGGAAQADVHVFEKSTFAGSFPIISTNFCASPPESYTGTYSFTSSTFIFQTSSGTYHVILQDDSRISAVGALGTAYHGEGHETRNFELRNAPAFDSTQTILFLTQQAQIGSGATPNVFYHALIKMTFNANGILTADVIDGGFSCRG